jgi:hypothetical protein
MGSENDGSSPITKYFGARRSARLLRNTLEPTAFQRHTDTCRNARSTIRTSMSEPSPSKSLWAKLGFTRDGFIAWALRILPRIDRLLMRSAVTKEY